MSEKIAIVGCGAMGSVYAALFADAGNEVWAIDTWQDHIDAINSHGLRVEGASGDRTVRIKATSDATEPGICDLVIVATKARDVYTAATTLRPLVGPDTLIGTFQNGLGAPERIAEAIETNNVLIGVVGGFGASMKGPGHAHHNGWQLVRMGEVSGGMTPRLERFVGVWQDAGFNAKAFDDIQRMVWEKFCCNVAYSAPCTLTGWTIGEVLADDAARRVSQACATEAYEVGLAKGIAFSFDDIVEYITSFGSNMPDARPSMLLDHMAGRKSEIDAINGAVPVEAAKLGMNAPINQNISDMVRARERDLK